MLAASIRNSGTEKIVRLHIRVNSMEKEKKHLLYWIQRQIVSVGCGNAI